MPENPQNSTIKMDEISIEDGNFDTFYTDYFNTRTPVVIKNALESWAFKEKWNADYISNTFGDHTCTLVNDGRPAYSREQSTLRKYFEENVGTSTLTLEKFEKGEIPCFFNDIPFPNKLFGPENVLRYFFFHSPKDGGTLPHLHHDAFNMLITGEKRWILHDAGRQSCPKGNLVMRGYMQSYPPGTQAKDWFENEADTIHEIVDEAYECIQRSGDIVFVPVEFSHVVLNHTEVMGLVVERSRNKSEMPINRIGH